jgi:7-cyano-7-deazaguanine reductase
MDESRNTDAPRELPANEILDDLVSLLQPRWMRATADFSVRGNIRTVVRAEHGDRERIRAGRRPGVRW